MFNYGDIIEYVDGTYDENFNNARKWANSNRATFNELIDRRKEIDGVLHRFYEIKEIIIPEPKEPTIEEQNEVIRQTRESLYRATSDYIKADYDEAVARGSENAEQLKQEWLASKDKIRAENPYIGGDTNGL